MNLLTNLLRVQRRACDDRRRYLADLETLAERLRRDAQRLLAGHDGAEKASARNSPGRPLTERYRRVRRSIAEIDAGIAAARESLAAAERQLQRYESEQEKRAGVAAPPGHPGRRRFRLRAGPAELSPKP
jgi:flagellar protein FliJ